jgi:hypothetical protein
MFCYSDPTIDDLTSCHSVEEVLGVLERNPDYSLYAAAATRFSPAVIRFAVKHDPLIFDMLPPAAKMKPVLLDLLEDTPELYMKLVGEDRVDPDVIRVMVKRKRGHYLDSAAITEKNFPILMKEYKFSEIMSTHSNKNAVKIVTKNLAKTTVKIGVVNELLQFDHNFIHIYSDYMNEDIVRYYLDAGGDDPTAIPLPLLNPDLRCRIVANNPLAITRFPREYITGDMMRVMLAGFINRYPPHTEDATALITIVFPYLKSKGLQPMFNGLLTQPSFHVYYHRVQAFIALEAKRTTAYFIGHHTDIVD